jgi:hypothetical protein
MMDCAQCRRALLADPNASTLELESHLASCAECRAYRERLLRFEGRLAQALRVDLERAAEGPASTKRSAPPSLIEERFRRGTPHRRFRARGLAIAASVLVALVAAGTLWIAVPHRSLAAAVVAHMAGEPEAWVRTAPVPSADLAPVLAAAHMRLNPDAGMVSYAQTCPFRGHRVPHLVVQTEMGPVTVMVLVHESSTKPQPFDEDGYRGMIVPVPGHGSLAVLARGANADLADVGKVAARVQSAITWTDPGT